ncbi:MAG TPA: amino acid adenylation domain-containing protein, partial [Longimicrobiaceae bacterium]|nr:amino acid adenylation domain-containing protein [Longimicrobiaceae bacterium]
VRKRLDFELTLAEMFERPVLTDFARAVEQAKRTELTPIVSVDRSARLPLSFAQQRLWFLEQLGGLGDTYHIPVRLRLRGTLDRAALVRALDRIVARHEVLRTTFAVVDGEPEQRILPVEESAFRLLEHDLAGEPEFQEELRRLLAEEASAPFHLAEGPLIRGRLIRLGEDDHVLLVTMHHVISDAWSMGVLVRELSALYRAYRGGADDPLPRLPVQYADYAVWQRRWVEGEVLERQASYWMNALAGVPELLALPADRPRPPRQDHAGARAPISFDEGLTAGLKALSQRHGTTLFMTLLAGWAAVLGRLSRHDDVVVGTPTANRGREEIEGLIGFFVNTLALRVDLSGRPTMAELVDRVKRRALEAQQHQDLPFEQVVERLDPERSLSHTPIFQVMFTWQNTPREILDLEQLELGAVGIEAVAHGMAGEAGHDNAAKFDLSLGLTERNGRIAGGLTYATALFERATIDRYVGYLRRVLEQVVVDESRQVRELELLTEGERAQVLDEWNRTKAPYPGEQCVLEPFEQQVERTPDAVAVVFEGEALSYAELNRRANRLAHHLIGQGVGPDVRVGLWTERSLEMMVGLLGVLKAGGAYVALDPSYPPERLRYMLQDSAPAVLLTQGRLRTGASSRGLLQEVRVPVVALDADAGSWSEQPETNPARGGLTPDHLAYVIYTSGSTGRPKGVMVAHRSLANVLSWMQEAWQLTGRDVVLQKTPYSFDASLRELLPPLLVGGRLVLARPGGHQDPAYLVKTIRAERVSALHFVPTLLQVLTRESAFDRCESLRLVVCGGEALPSALVRQFHERLPWARLYNVYGPTEATVDVTAWSCAAAQDRIPLGRPMANTRAYVLDEMGEPVPVGVVGELHVGGVQVARGYLNRPGLTAERFVPDPFSGVGGARLYGTGDLCRWSSQGVVEFMGRGDQQVKLRGFRVEPGEIEARLLEHGAVRDAVVVLREESAGGARLVAYYVAAEPIDAEVLRSHFSEALPEHMVPAAYVHLERLPLTPNGKLDRRALPVPEENAFVRREYEPPLGETEAALAEIWAEVLGVERVGRWDHFFELGGHSLLAVQVASRVRQVMGVEAALGEVFAQPVLTDFARVLEQATRAELPPIERVDRSARLPLSFAQQRLWFLEQLGGMGSTYHIPLRLRLRGDLDRRALVRALDRLVARHEVLRTTFAVVEGEPEQRIAPAEQSRFHLLEHDLAGHDEAEPELL